MIFTHAGNIGQVAFIPDDSAYQRYVISQRQFYLRCNTDLILPEFITYYFKTPEGQHRLLANANQVGVPSIARPSSYLKTIEVPAPSIEEQQVVVRNIKALDAKIRLNIGTNQTLEAMAQAIFNRGLSISTRSKPRLLPSRKTATRCVPPSAPSAASPTPNSTPCRPSNTNNSPPPPRCFRMRWRIRSWGRSRRGGWFSICAHLLKSYPREQHRTSQFRKCQRRTNSSLYQG